MPGAKLGRVALFGSDYGAGSDLDLFVYSAGELVGASASGSSNESVDLPAGTYDVYIVQFAVPAGQSQQTAKLNTFVVGNAAANLTVTPASQPVATGAMVTVRVAWSGLTPGKHYLGLVEYGEGATVRGRTVIAVNA